MTDDARPSSAQQIAAAKRAVRESSRAARCALDPETCQRAARDLADRLCALPELATAHVVLSYGATAEEIDPSIAVERLRAVGTQIAYPRIEAPGVLGLHLVADESELVHGPYGLTQPTEDATRAPFGSIDAVLVPGVAFDAQGWRLGYGGGYYDRLLPLLRADCVLIGIAYDEQLVDLIPAEEHDVRLDFVVTPTREIRVVAR